MKKPNITKGEWRHLFSLKKRPAKFDSEVCEIGMSFVVISNGDTSETAEADAKAISAVPEMIDALIESTKLLEQLKEIETESEIINKIEQQISMNKYSSLKKAGVQL